MSGHLSPPAPGVNRLPVVLCLLVYGSWINTLYFFIKGKGCLQLVKQDGNAVFHQKSSTNNSKIMFKKPLKCPFQMKNQSAGMNIKHGQKPRY